MLERATPMQVYLKMKLHLWLFMGVPLQRKSWLRLCKLSQKFRTLHFKGHVDHTKRSKIIAIRHIYGLKKTIKITFAAGVLPRTPLGSLQRSPDPVGLVAFKGRFAAGSGKEREKGRGREEKGGREGEGPPKSALDLPVRGGSLLHRF